MVIIIGKNAMKKLVNKNKFNEYCYINIANNGFGMLKDVDYSSLLACICDVCGDSTDVMAYCLADSGVKLLISMGYKCSIDNLIQNLCKYYRDALKFDDVNYTVTKITTLNDLLAVSKEIHTTTDMWLDYPHSSIRAYLYDDKPEFLNKTHISNIYGSAVEYLEYLSC